MKCSISLSEMTEFTGIGCSWIKDLLGVEHVDVKMLRVISSAQFKGPP